MFGLFRRPANDAVIDRLYALTVTASRQPVLYRDFGIPDTFEGRFESLTLHAVLVLRRLKTCAAPGPEMAQHLVDTVFKHFDRTLREMGVGDTSVPKRMKSLAEAFLGRGKAYDDALSAGADHLEPVLQRNVCRNVADCSGLVHYMLAVAETLDRLPLQAFVDGTIAFPPAAVSVEESI